MLLKPFALVVTFFVRFPPVVERLLDKKTDEEHDSCNDCDDEAYYCADKRCGEIPFMERNASSHKYPQYQCCQCRQYKICFHKAILLWLYSG